MNKSRGFQNDLSIGKAAELYSMKYHALKYKHQNPVFDIAERGKKYDWTMTIDDKVVRFENKHDIASYTTGNMAIEFRCNKQPSGVMASEADYYIFVFYRGMLRVKKDKLLSHIEDNWDRLNFTYNGGDGGRADNVLLSIDTLISLGVWLEEYSLEQYYTLHLSPYNLDALTGGTKMYLSKIFDYIKCKTPGVYQDSI